MKAISIGFIVAASFSDGNVHAQDVAKCTAEQGAIASIENKYKPSYSAIEQRGGQLGSQPQAKDEDKVKFNFKVDMKEQRWVLKLPSVTMERNEIVVGIPEVKMNLQRWSYDLPETRMVLKKTGQTPHTTCKDANGIPYDCRVEWKDSFAHMPVVTMVTHEMKLDIPEVTWKNQKMSWDVPKLTWVENTWVVKIPEFTLVNVAVEQGKDLKAQSEDLTKEIASINASRVADSRGATQALYSCFRGDMMVQQTTLEKEMDEGIASLTSTVNSIRSQGADPTKVPSTGSQAIDLVATLADMVTKRKAASDSFATVRAELDRAEKESFAKLE